MEDLMDRVLEDLGEAQVYFNMLSTLYVYICSICIYVVRLMYVCDLF